MNELVSIVITTYGRVTELQRAIKSVRNQTYKDIEIIVVDDNEDVHISEMVSEIVDTIQDDRIRLIKNKRNMGGALSRNEGIKVSLGEYIAFLDDDDEYLPHKIELQLKMFLETKDKKLSLVYCYCDSVNSKGEILQHYRYDFIGNCLYDAMKQCIAATSQWMCSKAALESVGLFTDTPCKQDSVVIVKLLAAGYSVNRVPKVLSLYHEECTSRISSKNAWKRIKGEETLWNLCRGYYKCLTDKQRWEVEYKFACALIGYYQEIRDIKRLKSMLKIIVCQHPVASNSLKVYWKVMKNCIDSLFEVMNRQKKISSMKNAIYQWIMKHEKLHYVLRSFRHINDKSFVRDFNNESLSILKVTSNGNKHKGKILYRIEDGQSGFFANYVRVLFSLWYADTMGMYPVVIWGDKCPYYEKDGVNGIFNVWEYYFEQYEDYHIEDLDSAYRVSDTVKDIKKLVFGINTDYMLTKECIQELGRIMKKYICLKPAIKDYIDQNIKSILGGKKTLGVQIRMGIMLNNFNNHPIVPTLDEYIEEIKSVYEKGYEQIFLATDDNRALERMKKEFGDCVVYYSDTTRVDGAYSTYCVNTMEELHNYKCGLEVLLDMYTLASCSALVAGLSKVSFSAQIAKAAFGEVYEDLRMIDKGLNHNRRTSPKKEQELAKKGDGINKIKNRGKVSIYSR